MPITVLPFADVDEVDRTRSSVQAAVKHIVSTFGASFGDVEGRLVERTAELELELVATA